MAALHAVGKLHPGVEVVQAGVVELVAEAQHGLAGLVLPGELARFLHAHVAAPHRPRMHHHVAGDGADHLRALLLPGYRARQVHQPAAFGIGRQAGGDGALQRAAQRHVGFQLGHEELGEAAADEEAVERRRQGAVGERVEGHQLGALGGQRLEVVGVVEAEGLVARDAYAQRRAGRSQGGVGDGGGGIFVAARSSKLTHAPEIDAAGNQLAHRAHALGCVAEFVIGHQTEVPLGQREARILGHGAQHRHVGVVLDDGAQLALVARPADVVEDHAADADARVEGLVAEDQRRDAARHAACVEHQQHRQAELGGERGVAVAAVQRQAVVQALVAFHQADVGTAHALPEDLRDLVPAHQLRIEVDAGPAGGQREPHRVDVVGALLEGLHRVAARRERRRERQRDRGLARTLVRGGDEQGGVAHGFTPHARQNRPAAGNPAPARRWW